jgi:decaprenylphospho-beta-D-ribofuranose 2-oxidase
VSLRAGGCSIDAQSLNDDLVVVLTRGDFARVEPPTIRDGVWTITVGPGVTTERLLAETRPLGLVPPVIVSTSHATAGGTLSADCLSRFSTTWGREGGHVLRFRLLTPAGKEIECRREAPPKSREGRLFRAVIGGLGYLGAVTEITYALRRVAPVGAPIKVETSVDKIEADEFRWSKFLGDLRAAAIEERDLYRALPEAKKYGLKKPAADVGNVFGAVWFSPRGMKGMILRSRYVVTEERRPMVLHQPKRADRVVVELGMANPDFGDDLNDLFFMVTSDHASFVDELEGYTFFMDGNVNAKHLARRLGSRMTLRQQTFVLPPERAESFAEEAVKRARAYGLETTLLDVLYLPAEEIPFLLSSTTDLEGFAMTFAFEDLNGARQDQVAELLVGLSQLFLDHHGRVHLTKTVEAKRSVIAEMYRQPLAEMLELKRTVDPRGILRNEFFDRVFGESSAV